MGQSDEPSHLRLRATPVPRDPELLFLDAVVRGDKGDLPRAADCVGATVASRRQRTSAASTPGYAARGAEQLAVIYID